MGKFVSSRFYEEKECYTRWGLEFRYKQRFVEVMLEKHMLEEARVVDVEHIKLVPIWRNIRIGEKRVEKRLCHYKENTL